ncbi:MAG TPA: permease [Candidatus Baltobacteraceae bacterium]
MNALHAIWEALFLAAGMFWQVGWSLILGFLLSGIIQAVVSKDRMRRALGRNGLRETALATAYGAASSSCSYAAAALSKTLFKKGAGLIPSLAFLFSSTNLVVELGLILYLLMGWQFAAGEWIGGVVLVAILALLVKATYPRRLVEQARRHLDAGGGHDHGDTIVEGATLWDKLRNPQLPGLVAQNFAMDWSMLWKDLLAGFLIAGALSAFVPGGVWRHVFLSGAPAGVQLVGNALVAPLIAIFTFVCSIGNVPMAAILWGSGISFGGVLAFLYADLIVLPLLDVYRRYYGLKMAAYIGVVFYATMVIAAILVDLAFKALHIVPVPDPHLRADLVMFAFNYTFWLNVVFGAIALYLWLLNRRQPAAHACH